jgi:L-rhamnose mutarotase
VIFTDSYFFGGAFQIVKRYEQQVCLCLKNAMTKEEYLRLAETKWPELEQLKASGDFYAYEKRFAEIWIELGRAVDQSCGL